MKKYIYNTNLSIKKNEKIFLEYLRQNTNIEAGGYKVYDGTGNHIMQNPEELVWLIKELQKLSKNNFRFGNFLEFGYASGITNTIFYKFFKFKKIVSVDYMDPSGGSKTAFFSNLRFKNILLVAGDSQGQFVKDQLIKNKFYDLIFIDGGHDYKVVKNDYLLALKTKSKKSVIVIHDIDCDQFPGPRKLWNEIKKDKNNKCIKKQFSNKNYFSNFGTGILIFK